MLRVLVQKSVSTASPSPPSDAGSPSHLSSLAEGATPHRASSSRTGRNSNASSRASATPEASPSPDASLEGFLHYLAQIICDVDRCRTVTPDQLVSQLEGALQNLGPQALTVVQEQMREINMLQYATAACDASECAQAGTASQPSQDNRVQPPPSSWGQRFSGDVGFAQKLPTPTDPEATEPISALLSAISAPRRTAVVPTPPPRSRRSSCLTDPSWFTRSPCFRLSSAEQAARLQAAHSCLENPPEQGAAYGALLGRLPTRLSMNNSIAAPGTGPAVAYS